MNIRSIAPWLFLAAVAALTAWTTLLQNSLREDDAVRSSELNRIGEALSKVERELAQIERQQRSAPRPDGNGKGTPLEADERWESLGAAGGAAEAAGLLPDVARELNQAHQIKQRVVAHRESLRQRRLQRQQADIDRYGPAIAELERRATAEGKEGEAAFYQLLEEYPESHASGSAIAERALVSAIDLNTEEVEKYYSQLVSSPAYKDAVTEQGIEATPALQGYLARQYISEGRFEEANALISSLSSDYSSQLIPDRGEGSEPSWIEGGQMARELHQELQKATGGQPSSTGGVTPGDSPDR